MEAALDKKKVLIGISGGVDSTTASLLLEKKGFEVSGLYFDITGCNIKGKEEARKALEAAGARGQFIYVDAADEFRDIVIHNFVSEYASGRTPNPCTLCNPTIKFRYLIEKADEIGAYYIATGHYAKVIQSKDGYYYIKAVSSRKDQSYMLYRLPQNILSRLILPLSEIEDKEEVRAIARDAQLPSADIKDSQEICFVEDSIGYVRYCQEFGNICGDNELAEKIRRALKSGAFVDKSGKILGKHQGILNYTIGQRKGLGIALGKPAFVTKLDGEKNQVILGENQELFSHTVSADGCFFTGRVPKPEERLEAKIRYAAGRAACTVTEIGEENLVLHFDEAQRAATAGQSLVIYDGDLVLGGGYIKNSTN